MRQIVRGLALVVGITLMVGCATTKLDPEQARAQALIRDGLNLYGRGEHDAAEKVYRQAVAADPKALEAWLGLGAVLAMTEQDEESEGAFLEAVKLAPKSSRAYAGLAVARSGKGDTAGAIQAFETAVTLEPTNVQARFGLGMAYIEKGDRARALEQARAIEPIDPALAKDLKTLLNPF